MIGRLSCIEITCDDCNIEFEYPAGIEPEGNTHFQTIENARYLNTDQSMEWRIDWDGTALCPQCQPQNPGA